MLRLGTVFVPHLVEVYGISFHRSFPRCQSLQPAFYFNRINSPRAGPARIVFLIEYSFLVSLLQIQP